ncbi:AraC family transcriptional regulator [Corallococcus sp. Z5C101001]|uniref:AraC family transcriptional regulator n=1 Tax=Corallococcus sp. Z5C101001 TaxID=2596829 RepID=UPI00117FDE43|nr:AraC family transcriptional regulator [Corallococcus sp. Z5C101001]TSC24136.1 helix-turn-helix transcriptional regulator [Corallococcus sp. Z5C101001]
MRYVEARPCAALAPYVECYWALELSGPAPVGVHRVLPDGCLDILVDLSAGGGPRVVGAMRTAEVVPLGDAASFIAVRFRPGGAQPFLRLPLLELTDVKVALGDLWPREAREWWERLAEAEGRAARFALLERLLLERLPGREGDAGVRHAVDLILGARGQVPVRSLEEVMGVGARQVERRFLASVGLSPKVLCRIARLQHAVALSSGPRALEGAAWALAAGYYDQAHQVREFRALTGLTPGAYVREQAEVGFVQSPGGGDA